MGEGQGGAVLHSTDVAPAIRYFEDFHPGQIIAVGTVAVSEDDIIAFARQYDPQPMHVDPAAAAMAYTRARELSEQRGDGLQLFTAIYGLWQSANGSGRVRAGLTSHSRAEIFRQIAADQIARCPFVNLPSSKTGHWGEGVTAEDMMKLQWVKPKVVVEVSFVEWTRDSVLRHSEFVGLREDKRPADVHREPSG